MKSFKIALIIYSITLLIALRFPTSSEYTTLYGKLIIAQIYAIPAFLITILLYIVFRPTSSIEERQE